MPSVNHEVLKLLAIDWLYQVKKCKWVACELKFGSYIYDVVGTDGFRIYVVEAKAQRGDFLRECNDPEDIKERIKELKEKLKETGDTDYMDLIHKEKEKGIKFYDKSVFKLANEAYIIAPQDMIMKEDLPPGWGLLDEEPMTVIKAPARKVDQKWITRIIGEIGKKHTKGYLKQIGVEFVGKKIIFPERYLIDDDREIEGEEDE